MTRENSALEGYCYGWANEKWGDWTNNQEAGERDMDDFNNSIGFALGKGAGSFQACESLCLAAASNGILRTYRRGTTRGYWR